MDKKAVTLHNMIRRNPNAKVIFFYPNDEICDDYYYTAGAISKVETDDFYNDDGGRIWLRDHDSDELFEVTAENIADDLFSVEEFPLSDEQEKMIELKAKEKINNIEWSPAIVVYLNAAML